MTNKQFNMSLDQNNMERMVHRLTDGLKRTLYHEVDYDILKARAMDQKFSSHKSWMKLKKFEQTKKQSKENALLKQHHLVWRKEFLRLNNTRRRLEHELESHIKDNSSQPDQHSYVYEDFDNYCSALEEDFTNFKEQTHSPVSCLREDLQFWLQKNRDELEIGSPEIIEASKGIKEAISSVKQQQSLVMEKLHNQELSLLQELNTGTLKDINLHRKCPNVERGIPEETFQLNCPDENLRAAVLQELLWLDEKYESRLDDLELRHAHVLLSDENDGWSEKDHYTFIYIVDQYTPDTPNRRQLLLDRLLRHLPDKSRPQLVCHETWHHTRQYYFDRRHAITSDWARDKQELLTKAAVVFLEAELLQEYDDSKCESLERQKSYCRQLADKVSQWREMKQEMMMLEEELERDRLEQFHERERVRLDREKEKRRSIKHKVNEYNNDKENRRMEIEENTRSRIEKLKVIMAEQAVHDSERVQFRIMETEKRNEEMKLREEAEEDKVREREERLEALRAQVRIVAEFDPVRTAQQTQSWYNRLHPDPNKDHNINKPLFDCHTFTANQISSDNRIKLESRLRDAGLLHSDYARNMISRVTPPTQPRKDNVSTVFKHLQQR